MRLTFADCPATDRGCERSRASRRFTITPRIPLSAGEGQREGFVAALAARDLSARLFRSGERAGWQVGATAGLYPPVDKPPTNTRLTLVDGARLIERRAQAQGWNVRPIRLYGTTGGGMVVIVRFDDRTLLTNQSNAFISTLYGGTFRPPVYRTLLLFEGPGDLFEGGGGPGVGASYGPYPPTVAPAHPSKAPTWLVDGPTQLEVTVTSALPGQRVERRTLRCGRGETSTPAATCARLIRDRAVLFAPVESDGTCLGAFGGETSVQGTIAGIAIRHEYDGCYGGVTSAWAQLLATLR